MIQDKEDSAIDWGITDDDLNAVMGDSDEF